MSGSRFCERPCEGGEGCCGGDGWGAFVFDGFGLLSLSDVRLKKRERDKEAYVVQQ